MDSMPGRLWPRLFRRKPKPIELTADLRERIRASFNQAAGDEEHFPSTIDPRIYHVRLILEYFGDLASKRVLDIGCGKGRFARILAGEHPCASVHAVDIAEAMLRFVPAGIRIAAASMTALPFASESFDAAYATESLEHAVDIDLAIGERTEGPIFLAADGRRLDRHGAGRIVRRVARRAGIIKPVGPHTLRHAFITAALDAGVPLRDVQEAASHADPRTTMRYDRARTSLDRHATYIVAAYVAGAAR